MGYTLGVNLSIEGAFGFLMLLGSAVAFLSLFDSRNKLRAAQKKFGEIERKGMNPKSLAFRQAGGLINGIIILAGFKVVVACMLGLAGWSLFFQS
ncbi:hypothetical protein A2886_01130 [candidate division WWE3 bacterium RIFCSPHIGHO2_01_FULL_42_13]|uniref:Uncharacterized protein n=1 Tax=candidate division WWE3 bacterium RIFCSPHIGHO2_01_FULL_42_13 TaxID=1802617 RepID=A0A1F4UQK5_UNCKA|nr:MAG: hypothetical protein A2886_01130 [candidate division WWE3 bacterium RIFCSPHIGHO2_01_FULL_42_13]